MKDPIKIPSESRMERLRELLTEDEDFRFPVIKLDSKKPRYELPAPTRDDPDNVEDEPTFRAVVIVARKNFYQSEEDKEAGKDPKEKRALYLVRTGKITPELIYLSPTSVRNWKGFVRDCAKQESKFFEVVVEFSAERVKGKQYTWNKVNLKLVRTLEEDELEHIREVREMVDNRVKEYEDDSELDRLEEEALNEGRRSRDDEEPEEKHSKRARASVEDDDDDEDDKKSKGKSSGKSSKKKDDDDDDDDEDDKKSKGKSSGKSSKKKDDDDDDDEDDKKSKGKSSGKASKKKDDDDDDDEDDKKSKGKGGKPGYPSLDDDDDDDDDD